MLSIGERIKDQMANGMRYCLTCLEAYSVEQLSTHSCGNDVDMVVDSKVKQKWPKKILSQIVGYVNKWRVIK